MLFERPHRLLHSLVFASALCLDGCATTTPQPTLASATAVEVAPAPVLSETPPDPLADARICERGWPTTKAGNGNDFQDCKTVTLHDGTERTECTDQEGRCALR